MAKAAGLTAMSLTDHDCTDGVAEAATTGESAGIKIISGIELTTESQRAEIHILGYFINADFPELVGTLEIIQRSRIERIKKIVKKLNQQKVDITAEEVYAIAGKKAPGRPHVARVLMQKGVVQNFKEAFNRYLDSRGPAYVPHFKLAPIAAIELIAKAGGIPVLAHPALCDCEKMLPELVSAGLRGLEVYYPFTRTDRFEFFLNFARENKLLVTGGSDFHGSDTGRDVKLGDIKLPDEELEKLVDEHLRGN